MYFRQFYLGCLAHASYLIGSKGEAAVVDPQRDVDPYIAEAARGGLAIRYVIETHLHADFVSGHRELAGRTGAEIVFGREAGAAFPHRGVGDGDEIRVGDVTLRVLQTPGHTPESISIVVIDREVSDRPVKVLTGDALFIGDVGRPDLAGARGYTAEDMAGMLYDSLHRKLLTLPDDVAVFPAHGAGSLCGRNISSQTSSTIGQQRLCNYALRPMPREEFIRMMTTDLPAAPAYFSRDAAINRLGAPPLDELPSPVALSPPALKDLAGKDRVVLDVRPSPAFGAAHVPGAVNIGLDGPFAPWAGTLVAPGTPILLVAEEAAQVREATVRLARVGHENVEGYLDGGILTWHEAGLPLARLAQIPVDELRMRMAEDPDLCVLDVRREAEWRDGHVPGARNVPLDRLRRVALRLEPEASTAVICAGGYRSSAAASLLLPLGHQNVVNVVGGMAAWKAAGFPLEVPSAPQGS